MTDVQVLDAGKKRIPIQQSVLNILLMTIIGLGVATGALAFGYISQQSEINNLEDAQLHQVGVSWYDKLGEDYINVNGAIFNSGTDPAYNVVLTVEMYYNATLIRSEEVYFGFLSGKFGHTLDVDIYCPFDPFIVVLLRWD